MTSEIQIGDRVRVHFDTRYGDREGWYEGRVFKIDPYSEHRSFYWVELDPAARAVLGTQQISIFNPKNIQKIDPANDGTA